MNAALQRSKLLATFNALQDNELEFNALALELYAYQKSHNQLYKSYLQTIGRLDRQVKHYSDISALPIQFFKTHDVRTGDEWEPEDVFKSSGTGGVRSRHLIRDKIFYVKHTERLFTERIGEPSEYCFLALLPGYLEREGSSLIEMVNHFITQSTYEQSGFYLNEYEELNDQLKALSQAHIPTILFGVSFALLDFCDQYKPDLSTITIIETGGMKGRGVALSKREILKRLQTTTSALAIYSEYGMTELLSQTYALDGLHFSECRTMKLILTDLNDPFAPVPKAKSGQVNVIDLANIDTCAFIQTQDIGKRVGENQFEILGRMDLSDMRGCNLLLDDVY